MDVLSIVIAATGVTIGVLSGGATFFNKQRFEAQNALLQAGNDELRNQNKDLRDERADLIAQKAAAQASSNEKERTIKELKNQPNLGQLTQLISNNHTEVITTLAGITKVLAEGENDRRKS